MRWMLLLGAAIMFAVGTACAADDPKPEPKVDPKAKQLKVQGKFVEILPEEKTEIPTRIPAYYTLEGRKSLFHSGGAPAIRVGADAPPVYGFSLQLTVSRTGGDDLVLDFALENSQLSGDAKTPWAHTVALSTVRKAKLGKSLRIILEEDAKGVPRQWLDLTVTEADE